MCEMKPAKRSTRFPSKWRDGVNGKTIATSYRVRLSTFTGYGHISTATLGNDARLVPATWANTRSHKQIASCGCRYKNKDAAYGGGLAEKLTKSSVAKGGAVATLYRLSPERRGPDCHPPTPHPRRSGPSILVSLRLRLRP